MREDNLSLIKKCLKKDEEAYRELIEKYKMPVYNLIYRMTRDFEDTKDLSQEVFLRVFLNLNKFNPEMKFSTWLYKIAVNLTINHIKKKRKIKTTSFEEIQEKDKILIEKKIEEKVTEKLVQDALNKLPEKYKIVLILKYAQGLKYEEIKDILGVEIGTIKMRVHRGKEMLYQELKNVF